MTERTLPPGASRAALLGMTLQELQAVAEQAGLQRYAGRQLADWLYKKQATDFAQMTNLPKAARGALAAHYRVGCSAPAASQRSADGTVKYLYRTDGGHYVETVYIPDGERATLCVSSQVGCKMGCAFCMTGRQGFAASLSAADILNQVYSLPERGRLTNIVFMGQGEPFDNLDNVLRATKALTADWGYAWSPRRITVSSVGLAKGLERFLAESECHLAISLHHPLHEGRAALMPAERAFPICDVAATLRRSGLFSKGPERAGSPHQRRLSFEYIPFEGVNDSPRHARAVVDLLRGLDCRVNLIRFHGIPGTPLRGITEGRMVQFRDYLTGHGIFTTIRASRGEDIMAACGLLSTTRQEAERQAADREKARAHNP